MFGTNFNQRIANFLIPLPSNAQNWLTSSTTNHMEASKSFFIDNCGKSAPLVKKPIILF